MRDGEEEELADSDEEEGAPLGSEAASERFAVAVRFRARSRSFGEEGISLCRVCDGWWREREEGERRDVEVEVVWW